MVHLRDSASPYGVFVQIREEGVPSGCMSATTPSKEKRWGWISNPNDPPSPGILKQSMIYGRAGSNLSPRPSREVFLMFKVNALNSPDLISHPLPARPPSTPAYASRAPLKGFQLSIPSFTTEAVMCSLSTSMDLSVSSSSYLSASGLSLPSSALPTLNPGSMHSGCGYHTCRAILTMGPL